MLKKIDQSGALYFLIAILFAIGAISRSISNDSNVILIQWLCVVIFAVAGLWKLRRKE